jgi:hypothetical protein
MFPLVPKAIRGGPLGLGISPFDAVQNHSLNPPSGYLQLSGMVTFLLDLTLVRMVSK